jgi:hypothetical protein
LKALPVQVGLFFLGATALFFACAPESSRSDDGSVRVRNTEMTPAAEQSVTRGLDFLAKTQRPDGSWSCKIGYKLNFDYLPTGFGPHVGVTALAGMAFMAKGHLPGRGRYGRNVRKAVDFVISCIDPNTGFISHKLSRMYSHAFASLFLAEIYGMTHRADLKEKLKLVVDLLVSCQNPNGGWRYLPFATEADISLTVCQLQFLRAARNCGITVRPSTIKRAIAYVKSCATDSGAFRYQMERHGARTTFALTAAGVTALHSSGVYVGAEVRRGLLFLQRSRPRRFREGSNDFHYFYGHYYAIQAFYQEGGRLWELWWPSVRDELVRTQHADGSWFDEVGPTYATAMATLILSLPLEMLPIFQR